MIVDKLKTKKIKKIVKTNYIDHDSVHTQNPVIDEEDIIANVTQVQPTIICQFPVQNDKPNKNGRIYNLDSAEINNTKPIGVMTLCNLSRVEDERDDDYIDEYFD